MLYTKLGSIPQPQTDGTDGWIEVADKPECPEGKEVVWLNWEWVVRDPKPEDREGYQWNWNHSDMAWVESAWGLVETPEVPVESLVTDQILNLTTEQLSNLTTSQISGLQPE